MILNVFGRGMMRSCLQVHEELYLIGSDHLLSMSTVNKIETHELNYMRNNFNDTEEPVADGMLE